MNKLTWTNARPTTPGLYWLLEPEKEPTVVKIAPTSTRSSGGELLLAVQRLGGSVVLLSTFDENVKWTQALAAPGVEDA